MGKTTRSVKKCFLRENKSVRHCKYSGEWLFAFLLSVSPVTGTPRNCLCGTIWHRLVWSILRRLGARIYSAFQNKKSR
jgi:hypothetical protein